MKKVTSFWRDVCKEEIRRLPEFPKTQKNLPEFHQQKLATLGITEINRVNNSAWRNTMDVGQMDFII